jgi:hypothetical protein
MLAVLPALGETFSPLDIEKAAELLAEGRFGFPAEVSALSSASDGLPGPDEPEFAMAAAEFVEKEPITPASALGPTLWDTKNTSSRQVKCLAYLAAGSPEKRREVARLCILQARRIQWAMPVRTGSRRAPDRNFCASAAALAMTARVLSDRADPDSALAAVAAQWLRTARGQFATYADGQKSEVVAAASAVFDDLGPVPERLETYPADESFFSQLDLSRPDMREVAQAVAGERWSDARDAYLDVLSTRFRRPGWPDVNFWKAVDLKEADDICRNIFLLQAHMFRRYDYGDEVDWAKVIDDDIESRVWMNAHPWVWTLINAYEATGDEKYVDHLCRHFNSWYSSSPPPFRRSSSQWRTLECGGRAGQKWGVMLLRLAGHPRFKRECLFHVAESMLAHGKYLSMYSAGGGNWLQVESSGLACVALLFPEFKLSPLFYEVAMDRLDWVNARAFLPDGFQTECSPGYHRFPLIGIATALRLARHTGAPVSENLMKQYESGVEAVEYIAYPDNTLPMINDVSPQRHSVMEVFQTGAEVFGRDDFRWFASWGAEGTRPEHTSHDFTHAGFCVMRDRWGPEGQVVIFDAGCFGSGHQHEDKLSFVYYAGGREMIGDPGIYSYRRDEFEPYWRGSWSHNTVVIDGLSQHRGLGPPEEIPDPDRRFVMGDGFDFAVGAYRRAYSPRGAAVWGGDYGNEPAKPIRDVQHERCLFNVKGRYLIVCDRVLGQGEHVVDLLFHPSPIIAGEGASREARAVDLTIRADGAAITDQSGYSNVAILPADMQGCEVLDLVGQRNPVRGWYAAFGIVPSHDVVYRRSRVLPCHFETVIEPLLKGTASPLNVRRLEARYPEGRLCAALACGADRFLVSYDGPAEIECGAIRFSGTALHLTCSLEGRPLQARLVDGKSLSIDGRALFSTDTPSPALTLNLQAPTTLESRG